MTKDDRGLKSLWQTSRSSGLIPPELPVALYCQKDQLLNTPVGSANPWGGGSSKAGSAGVPTVRSHGHVRRGVVNAAAKNQTTAAAVPPVRSNRVRDHGCYYPPVGRRAAPIRRE